MKKVALSLAFIALVASAATIAEARTRVSVGFNYGGPGYRYRLAYSHPVVSHTAYPRYRYKWLHRPYYWRTHFKHRPYTRIVVRSCY